MIPAKSQSGIIVYVIVKGSARFVLPVDKWFQPTIVKVNAPSWVLSTLVWSVKILLVVESVLKVKTLQRLVRSPVILLSESTLIVLELGSVHSKLY